MKRHSRTRQLPTLKEREVERKKERQQKRAARTPKNKKKPPSNVLPFDPNAPVKLESQDTIYIKYIESLKNFPWKKLAVTFVVILIGGVGSAAFQARNANIQTEINNAERELRELRTINFTSTQQLRERYSNDEIERIATERLGMSFPDQSQIIIIDVPRVGGVTLNTAEYALPQHNYFLADVSNFLSGIFNQIFGGR